MPPGFFEGAAACQNGVDGLFNPWPVVMYGGGMWYGLWIGLTYGLWIELAIVVIGALAVWRPLPRGGVIAIGAVALGAFFATGLYNWTAQRNLDDCLVSFPPEYDALPLFEAVASRSNTVLVMTFLAFLIGTALTAWLVLAGWRSRRAALA